jgi:hypothetical protein
MHLAQEELKKYDQLKADIRANCERQAELLTVLAQQQAAFRSAFGFADWRRACEVCVVSKYHGSQRQALGTWDFFTATRTIGEAGSRRIAWRARRYSRS